VEIIGEDFLSKVATVQLKLKQDENKNNNTLYSYPWHFSILNGAG
jgi:hypothetical protein